MSAVVISALEVIEDLSTIVRFPRVTAPALIVPFKLDVPVAAV